MLARKRSATASAVPDSEPPLSATRFAFFAGLVAIPRPWPRRAPRGGWRRHGALTTEPAAAQLGPHRLQFPLHICLPQVMGVPLLASPTPGFPLQNWRGRKWLFSFSPLGSLTVHLHVRNLSWTGRRMFLTQQPPG